MIEILIEKLINEGKITREQIDELIEHEKANNPITSLEKEIADLWYVTMMGGNV